MYNSKLFEKITLNNGVEIDNRLAIPPLTLFTSNQDGSITDEERNYLKVRGKDIGLYILGATIISKEGMSTLNFPIAMSEKDHRLKKEQKLLNLMIQKQFVKLIMLVV